MGVYTSVKNFDLLDNDYIRVIGNQLKFDVKNGKGY